MFEKKETHKQSTRKVNKSCCSMSVVYILFSCWLSLLMPWMQQILNSWFNHNVEIELVGWFFAIIFGLRYPFKFMLEMFFFLFLSSWIQRLLMMSYFHPFRNCMQHILIWAWAHCLAKKNAIVCRFFCSFKFQIVHRTKSSSTWNETCKMTAASISWLCFLSFF